MNCVLADILDVPYFNKYGRELAVSLLCYFTTKVVRAEKY